MGDDVAMTSTTPALGSGTTVPALERHDLLAGPVAAGLSGWAHATEVGIFEIDPTLADTAACSEAYRLPLTAGANCVVVSGRRAGEERVAACVVRADTRADVNTVVKRLLDVRKASFLDLGRAVAESGMEHGGITPIGLPAGWRVLVDAAVLELDVAVIGSGVRRSKLLLPGRLAGVLPGAEVVEGLGR
jgi:prolyl-tRNA editing enzyme YbaK/EbsC (Cys-tRNA(Pro) deacylase)